MDFLHIIGINLIGNLQKHFRIFEKPLTYASHLGDPKIIFIVFFPSVYYANKNLGLRVVLAAVIAEWINAIFKWLLFGERPYWWVKENAVLFKAPPVLKQYHLTCETGPGSPSGHSMVLAAVLFSVVYANNFFKKRPAMLSLAYSVVIFILILVGLSRLFIATHFPHQVLCGFLTGYIIAVITDKIKARNIHFRVYVCGSVLFLLVGLFTYQVLLTVGYNPNWSIDKARKWCAKPEWVYIDTTLFFAIVRDSAILLGMGASVAYFPNIMALDTPWKNSRQSLLMRLFCSFVVVFTAISSEYVHISKKPLLMFYGISYLKYVFLPIFVFVVVPLCACKMFCKRDFAITRKKNC